MFVEATAVRHAHRVRYISNMMRRHGFQYGLVSCLALTTPYRTRDSIAAICVSTRIYGNEAKTPNNKPKNMGMGFISINSHRYKEYCSLNNEYPLL